MKRQANQVEDHCNESNKDDTFAILHYAILKKNRHVVCQILLSQ